MPETKHKWAMVSIGDKVLDYTLSDSADAAIKALAVQLGGKPTEDYESMARTGFSLARVRVTTEVIKPDTRD